MKRYFNAYRDKDGTDFHGTPWIDELSSKKKTVAMLSNISLKEQGYKEVKCFEVYEDDIPEIITWDYVKEHEIVNYKDVYVI